MVVTVWRTAKAQIPKNTVRSAMLFSLSYRRSLGNRTSVESAEPKSRPKETLIEYLAPAVAGRSFSPTVSFVSSSVNCVFSTGSHTFLTVAVD